MFKPLLGSGFLGGVEVSQSRKVSHLPFTTLKRRFASGVCLLIPNVINIEVMNLNFHCFISLCVNDYKYY